MMSTRWLRLVAFVTITGCQSGGTAPTDGGPPGGDPDASTPGDVDGGGQGGVGRVFDHRHTDLAQLPAACIEALKSSTFVFHYAHRSHGSQIIWGAESLEAGDATYGFAAEYCSIPGETGALKMWDGMTDSNLVEADQYWATAAGREELGAILDANPELRYSSWAWSFEISDQTEATVREYLETMAALEAEHPDVTFVYMTGPAVGPYGAVNRAARNEQIRAFTREGNRVLFDFEDLDVWWSGERHTETIDGVTVPMEHPRYSLSTPGNEEYQWTHTTRESCETKARAFWTMLAHLEGCATNP